MTNLQFHSLGSFAYPYPTSGASTSMTMAKYEGDYFLVFLTQTSYEDDIVYLHPEIGDERRSLSSGPDNHVITGMAYDEDLDGIWVSKSISPGNPDPQTIRLLDHDAQLVNEFPQPAEKCHGIAVSGNTLVVSATGVPTNQNELHFLDKNTGSVLQTIPVPIDHFSHGLTSFAGHLVVADSRAHKVYVIDPAAGSVLGVLPTGPGTPASTNPWAPEGLQAIAADNVRDLDDMPQPLECVHGASSQAWQDGLCDPALPWNPAPWGERHRIYIANETDQQIHVGYFTV